MNGTLKRFLKSRKIYIGLIASYIIILLIFTLFAFIGYDKLYRTRRDQIEQQYESRLAQAVYLANDYVSSVRQSMLSVLNGKEANSFVYTKYPMNTDNYYNLRQTINEIAGINQASEYGLFLYVKGIDSIVSTGTRLNVQAYYDIELRPEDLSVDEFRGIMDGSSYFNISHAFYRGTAKKAAALITASMPLASTSPRGTVCGYLDFDKLLRGFSSDMMNEYGLLTVSFGDNTLISTGNMSTEAENPLVFNIDGALGLKYTLKLDTSLIAEELTDTRRFIIRMMCFELLGGILFALLLARTNYSPLKQLLEQVGAKDATGEENEYERILNAAGELTASNEELRGKLNQQLPLLRASVLRRMLMRSGNVDAKELVEFGVELHDGVFAVMLIGTYSNQNSPEDAAVNYSIIGLSEAYSSDKLHMMALETGTSRIAVILNAPVHGMPEQAREFVDYLKHSLRFEPLIGLSDESGDIHALPQLYEQALEAYEYAHAWRITGLTEYGSLPAPGQNCLPDEAQENALFDALEAGDSALACKIIRTALAKTNGRPLFELQMTVCSILRMICRVCESRRIPEDERPEMPQLNDVLKVPDELCRLAEKTAHLALGTVNAPDENIGSKVIQLLAERYSDSSLSLTDVAEELNLSVSYLSHTFKQQTGTGFADALNNIRLEHAAQLLRETNLTVQNIAQQCGYTGAAYFSRVFKKQYGITPGQYRDK